MHILYVYCLTDFVKHGVLTPVIEILRCRNYCYYYYHYQLSQTAFKEAVL